MPEIPSRHSAALAMLTTALMAVALFLDGAVAHATPFTGIVVFGDSLSDVGNTSAATLGFTPGGDYFQGRFSNGPVYAERLAAGLGFGPLTRSGQGGADYAFGGAETDGPNGFFNGGFLIDSLVEQVDDYLGDLGGDPADANALHVVFIGANDFLNGQTSVDTPAAVVRAQIERLVDAGARRLLGVTLPRLGLTPDNFGNTTLSGLASSYNDALQVAYSRVEADTPGVAIDVLDVESLFDELIATPEQWGFTNTTGQGVNAADPAGFVFWDGVHPTREAHVLLGEAALRAVLPAGDYDRDGFVTPADYAPWRNGFGAVFDAAAGATEGMAADANGDGRVDAADYTTWRDGVAAAPASVPEPSALGLIAGCAVFGRTRQRRSVLFAPIGA